MSQQEKLFQDSRTAEEGHAVVCHQDFLQKLEAQLDGPRVKKASKPKTPHKTTSPKSPKPVIKRK